MCIEKKSFTARILERKIASQSILGNILLFAIWYDIIVKIKFNEKLIENPIQIIGIIVMVFLAIDFNKSFWMIIKTYNDKFYNDKKEFCIA